jgi:hypothetical protein
MDPMTVILWKINKDVKEELQIYFKLP